MSSVRTAAERLRARWQTVQQEWRRACELWRDPVRQRFEREFWQDWERAVPSAYEALEELAEVMGAARQAVH